MDEKTERLSARFPEGVVVSLEALAEARGWSLSRTLRWAVSETLQREYGRDLEQHLRERDDEIAQAGMPPQEVV